MGKRDKLGQWGRKLGDKLAGRSSSSLNVIPGTIAGAQESVSVPDATDATGTVSQPAMAPSDLDELQDTVSSISNIPDPAVLGIVRSIPAITVSVSITRG